MSARRASRLRAFAARLRGFLHGSRQDDEFDEEMEEHLRLLAERFVAQGMPRNEAFAKARRQFGNATLLQEDRRALQTLPSVEALWHDLRSALRTLTKNPGFAVVSIVTLGLGIGAATAIYSVIHNVMLAPFPYPAADRMVFPRIYDTLVPALQSFRRDLSDPLRDSAKGTSGNPETEILRGAAELRISSPAARTRRTTSSR